MEGREADGWVTARCTTRVLAGRPCAGRTNVMTQKQCYKSLLFALTDQHTGRETVQLNNKFTH